MPRLLGLGLVALFAIGCTGSSSTTATAEPGADRIARFAGSWYRHGVSVTVSASGDIEAHYRVYDWCSDHAPPCDDTVGDEIVNGGHLVGHLEPSTPRSAKVIVTSDTADLVIDDPAIFELLDDGKARLAEVVLCGETTTNHSECGA